MKEFQQSLVSAWRDYASGKIDAKTLKGASAGFGIYEQRNPLILLELIHDVDMVTPRDGKEHTRHIGEVLLKLAQLLQILLPLVFQISGILYMILFTYIIHRIGDVNIFDLCLVQQ